MTWKIVERISSKYPGSIINLTDRHTRLMYFWDEKYDSWSVIKEEQDEKSELWFIVSIDKAKDDWYLEGDVPVVIANWVIEKKENQSEQ